MRKVVVMGHGGYARGVENNISMIAGLSSHMFFIDLTKEDDLASLQKKVDTLLEGFGEDEVLFACDLLGASPFRIAAETSIRKPDKYKAVAGLNAMALLELNLDIGEGISLDEFVDRAIETTKESIGKFPE